MRDLAPSIVRQRLLIEGIIGIDVVPDIIKSYFNDITRALHLRAYGEPIIYSPSGMGSEDNQGYDAFVPLIDSGIALYVWSNARFASIVIYTCKSFDATVAVEATRHLFAMKDIESQPF
jgi:S-adenosylmethionine decarboxylase